MAAAVSLLDFVLAYTELACQLEHLRVLARLEHSVTEIRLGVVDEGCQCAATSIGAHNL